MSESRVRGDGNVGGNVAAIGGQLSEARVGRERGDDGMPRMGTRTAPMPGHSWECILFPARAGVSSWVPAVTPDKFGEVVLTQLPWPRLGVMIGPVGMAVAMHWGTTQFAVGSMACSPGVLPA